MNISLRMLERLIDLPVSDPGELRQIFDDLGLEVKDVTSRGADTVFNIETLAHRGDHLHVLGIAREFSARYLSTIKRPQLVQELPEGKPSFSVRNDTEKCLRYGLMEMQLPANMQLREDVAQVIGEADQARHPVVDLLNYVLLEIGQPLHAFDREKVEGQVTIVLSDKAEKIEALDGNTYTVPAESILIKDRKKTIAVAGVIGCANSMVTESTTRVLVESATFDPISIRKTARQMGLSTDASYLFEKGSDLEMVLPALKRLAYLATGSGSVVASAESAHVLGYHIIMGAEVKARKISLEIDQIRKAMKLPRLKAVEIITRLKYLGYLIKTVEEEKEYLLTVPSWRYWNVHYPSAVVEDFCRSHGVNRVKLSLPLQDFSYVEDPPNQVVLDRLQGALLGNGFFEVMTKSYYSAEDVDLIKQLDPASAKLHIGLKNAVDRSYSHLKVTNILHLASLLERNCRQGVAAGKVFEFARLFGVQKSKGSAYEFERDVLSIAASGRWYKYDWRKAEPFEECIALFNGVLHSVFSALGVAVEIRESAVKLLHPGIQGRFAVGRIDCGFFGAVHPLISEKLDLSHEVLFAEIDVSQLLRVMKSGAYCQPSDYPTVKKDLTLKLAERTLAAKVVKFINDMGIDDLQKVDLVDQFKKEGEDFRRVSYRLTFQSSQRTLEHSEVDSSFEKVIEQLADKHSLEIV